MPGNPPFTNLVIVLVEPIGSLNIGSVARSMLNFGADRLRLVAPKADHYNDDARRMAVKGKTILARAEIFPDLQSALADCRYSFATSRRSGKYRDRYLLPDEAAPPALAFLDQGLTAYVFGREDHGLSTKEIDLCQRLVTIPTHDEMPSLNLAHAVTICLYELRKEAKRASGAARAAPKLATGGKLEHMLAHMRRTLIDIGYLDPQNPDHITRAFRQMFGRAGLTSRDVRILEGLWSRIDWLRGQIRRPGDGKG